MNFNLSLAAASLLCGVSLLGSTTTTYVPITTTANDGTWKMFGVNGFSKDAIKTNVVVMNGDITTNTDYTSLSNTKGTNATEGWGDLKTKLKLLDDATNGETMTLYADISDNISNPTDPVRVLYIAAPNGTTPIAKVDYKSSLEGETVFIKLDNISDNNTYKFIMDSQYTYNNPVVPELVPQNVASNTASTQSYTQEDASISSILDFDLSNNPKDPKVFKADYLDKTASDITAKIYRYDSTNALWEVWNKDNGAGMNDFDTLEKGRAYWIKVDDTTNPNDITNGSTKATGLILGDDGVSSSDYSNLQPGWNLISFSSQNNSIIESTTGLIVDGDFGSGYISDISGVYKVFIDDMTEAKIINNAVANAKKLGKLPENFNITAIDGNSKIILLSNTRFIIHGDSGDDVTTLAGGYPFDIETQSRIPSTADMQDGISPVYGEYSMVIEPLVDTGSASNLEDGATDDNDIYSAAMMINNDADQIIHLGPDGDSTDLATVDTAINAAITNGTTDLNNSIEIDLDGDGTTDHLLISATSNFKIKDHTFTKVFDVNTTSMDGVLSYYINYRDNNGAGAIQKEEITTGNGDDIDAVVAAINGVTDTTGIYAAKSTTDKLVIVSASQKDLDIIDDTNGQFFTESTESEDIAKGAIKAIYNPKDLVNSDIKQNNIQIPFHVANDGDDFYSDASKDFTVSLDTVTGLNGITDFNLKSTFNGVIDPNDSDSILNMYDKIVEGFNKIAIDNDIYITVSHNYDKTTNNNTDANITITGFDLKESTININSDDLDVDAVEQNAPAAGFVTLPNPMTADLGYSPINLPDMPANGPLHLFKELGFDIKSLISAKTDMATGNIKWSNIDLTAPKSVWYNSTDYNLFDIDSKAGYWAYLTAANAAAITIDANNQTKSYTHKFDANNQTKNVVEITSMDVMISGFTQPLLANVYTTINGNQYKLTPETTPGNYKGYIGKFNSITQAQGTEKDIELSANGLSAKLDKTSVGTLDVVQPDAPTISMGDGSSIAITDASADVAGYYIFKGDIPELDTEADKFAYIAGNTASLNICEQTALTPTFGSAVTNLKIFAVDGDGMLGKGLASNSVDIVPEPILLNANTLESTGAAINLSTGYDSLCQADATKDGNKGITLEAKAASTIKISFQPITAAIPSSDTSGIVSLQDVMYIKNGSGILAKILFHSSYNGQTFYINVDGTTYKTTFDNTKNTTTNAVDITDVTVSTPIAGQSF